MLSSVVAWRWTVADAPLRLPAVSGNHGARPNAAHLYRAADEAMELGRFDGNNLLSLTLKQKESLLKQNATCLRLARAGFAFRYGASKAEWVVAQESTGAWIAAGSPGLMYSISSLFLCEAEVDAAKGKYGKAFEATLDALRIAQDLGKGPVGGG